MDAQHPSSDNVAQLNELERRLASWRPAADGLASDALLFAAGQAAARRDRNRFRWPAVAGCLTLLAMVLSGWLTAERSERLALARQLQQQTPIPLQQVAMRSVPESGPTEAPP